MRALGLAFWVLAASLAAAEAQPASPPGLTCEGDSKPWLVAELLFGRTRVNNSRWTRFLADEVTPRFPDGFTVLDGSGQWRAPGTQRIILERSTMMVIAVPPGSDTAAQLQAVIAAYKTRFNQQSVGLIQRPACVSF